MLVQEIDIAPFVIALLETEIVSKVERNTKEKIEHFGTHAAPENSIYQNLAGGTETETEIGTGTVIEMKYYHSVFEGLEE